MQNSSIPTRRRRIPHALRDCLFGVCLLGSGCASLTTPDSNLPETRPPKKSLADRMPWSKNKAPQPYPTPAKLAATWAPDTLTQSGRVSTRGFGARIFFYDEKSRPVPVDGTLIVHGLEEVEPGQQPSVKRFEFTREQLTHHYSQSDLGASYSVWIPWDAVGGKQTRIQLVPSFQNVAGTTIQGTPSTVLLPGVREGAGASLAQRYSPEYRQWKLAAAGNMAPTSGLTTTTISRPATQRLGSPHADEAPQASGPANWNVATQSGATPAVDVAIRSTPGPSSPESPLWPEKTGNHPNILPAAVRLPATR